MKRGTFSFHVLQGCFSMYSSGSVNYNTSPEVCGHPFRLVDSAVSVILVADRCIKLSTQPCNLHRQILAVEWPYWRAQWLSTWHRHTTPPFQQVSSSNFCPAWDILGKALSCFSMTMPIILEWDVRWAGVHILLVLYLVGHLHRLSFTRKHTFG